MSDHDRDPHDYIAPPPAPSFGWVSGTSAPNPEVQSQAELQGSVERHQREAEAEGGHRPWWKRLFNWRSG